MPRRMHNGGRIPYVDHITSSEFAVDSRRGSRRHIACYLFEQPALSVRQLWRRDSGLAPHYRRIERVS